MDEVIEGDIKLSIFVSIAMRGQLILLMSHIYWRSISKYLSDETSILVTGDMQMIDEFTMLWIKRLVMMPIMMDMNRCGRNVKDKKTIIHLINHDVCDDMKMMMILYSC